MFKNGELISVLRSQPAVAAPASDPNIKTIALGGFLYNGPVDANGCPNGAGSLAFPQGDRYIGEFVKGRRRGNGTYTFACGDVYEGLWKNDVRHGMGVLRYANGDVYKGTWSNDARSGQGALVFACGGSFVGQWEDDSYGEGVMQQGQETGT